MNTHHATELLTRTWICSGFLLSCTVKTTSAAGGQRGGGLRNLIQTQRSHLTHRDLNNHRSRKQLHTGESH